MCDQHEVITDARSAENICIKCGIVLEENLFYSDIYHIPHNISNTHSKIDNVRIDGEDPMVFLQKICDRLHVPESTIGNTFRRYKNTRKMVHNCIGVGQKKKKEIMCEKNLIVYSLYNRLKMECVPRPLLDICSIADVNSSSIIVLQKFLEQRKMSEARSKPLSAKNLIESHYTYINDLNFADLQVMIDWLEKLRFCSFTPATVAAGVTFLYLNELKKSNVSQSEISNLFHVTPISIQRFLKRYKNDILS